MKTIAITNQKGGIGKTTTAVTLAHGLALAGKRVLLIDFDPQGQSATSLGMNAEPLVFQLLFAPNVPAHSLLRNTGRENLFLISGDQTTATAQIVLAAEQRPLDAIGSTLRPFSKDFDVVVFDTAPSVGGIQERAIWASDLVIIPAATDFLAIESLEKTLKMISGFVEIGWRGRLAGILPTMYDSVTKESRNAMEYLDGSYKGQILSPVRRATILRECAADGMTIWEKAPTAPVAEDYQNLTRRISKL